MSIFEDIFGTIGKAVQKPQSVTMGIWNELGGSADDARDFMRKYEYALVDDTPENASRYEQAKRMVGSSDSGVEGPTLSAGNILHGAVQGAKSNITPSDTLTAADQGNPVLNMLANTFVDPLMVTGGSGVAGKVPGRAGQLLESATTVGKLGEGASKADKAAQAARYLYQGMLSTSNMGNPMAGVAVAGLLPVAERGAGKLFAKLGTKAAGELVGNDAVEQLSRTGLDKIESEYQTALQALSRDMPEASMLQPGRVAEGNGFSVQAKGGPVELFRGTGDPVADEARAYLTYNPSADAADVLFDVPGVKGMDHAASVIERAKAAVDKSGIPLNDRAALFNKKLMDDLGWSGQLVDTWRLPPGLPEAPVARPMSATTSTAIERFQPELGPLSINEAPTAYGAMDISQFGPKPSMLPPGVDATPMPAGVQPGDTSPFVSRPRGVNPDVEMLKQVLSDALLEAEKRRRGAPALNRGMSAEEELLFKLAGG